MREPRLNFVGIGCALLLAGGCERGKQWIVEAPAESATKPLISAPSVPTKYEWVGEAERGSGDPGDESVDNDKSDGSPECADSLPCWSAARWTLDNGGTLAILRRPIVHQDRCRPTEVWFTHAGRKQKLLQFCNDGYGASGVGTDSITVVGNELTYGRYGGSSRRWDTSSTFSLVPFRIKRTERSAFVVDQQRGASRWDWLTLGGSEIEKESGQPVRLSLVVPQLELPPLFEQQRWRHIDWKCGATGGYDAPLVPPNPPEEDIDASMLDALSRGPLTLLRSKSGTMFLSAQNVNKTDYPELSLDDVDPNRARKWTVHPARNATSGSLPHLVVEDAFVRGSWRVKVELPPDITVGVRFRAKGTTWDSGSTVRLGITATTRPLEVRCIERDQALVPEAVECPRDLEGCP